MARQIIYDEDTLVGYNYPKKKFYVTNKNTTTYRSTSTLIKEVLDIVAPLNTISTQEIQALQDTFEQLQYLSYSLSDTGSYISTIQFNDYIDYPLTVDLDKSKLYIMNTNLIFDLTLNETPLSRITYICSFYKEKLGLIIDSHDMKVIYDLLLSYYEPTVYNIIQEPKDKTSLLKYTNKLSCSNYNSKGIITYSCTSNPNNTNTIYHLKRINSNKTIELLETPNPALEEGDKLFIDTYTFNVESQDNNIITVKEDTGNITYSYNFYKAYSLSPTYNINSIDSSNKEISIVLGEGETITGLQANDKIIITGTTTTNEEVTISNDGEYTISSISSNIITVVETPKFTQSFEEVYPQLYKRTFLSNILKADMSIVTLEVTLTNPVPLNTSIQIMDNNVIVGTYSCVSSTTTELTLMNVPRYTPELPQVEIPSPNITINTTNSNNEEFPIGEFTLDKFSQLQAFINTYENLPSNYKPTDTNMYNLYANVPESMSITLPIKSSITSMKLLGLYSEIYKEKK